MTSAKRPADVLRCEVQKWLELEDDLLPDSVLAVAVTNRLDGPPVWLMIVAPPSSAKSELITAAGTLQGVRHLSSISENTLASGLRQEAGQKAPLSLLDRLKKDGTWLLTVKDFGTIQSLHPNKRNAIYGQLREIYDGKYDAAFGSGVEVKWQGKLGLIVGATPEVDRLQKWSTALGERFVQFRPLPPDSGKVAVRAISTAHLDEEKRRAALAAAFNAGFDLAMQNPASATPSVEGNLVAGALAQFVAIARTPIRRDGDSYDVSEPEGPGRLGKALSQLHRGAMLVYGGDLAAATRLIVRVGVDSVPGKRGIALRLLAENPEGVLVETAAKVLRCDINTAQRELNDLVSLGLAEKDKQVNRVVYRQSMQLQDYAARIFLDEFQPDEAVRKLFDLPSNYSPEGVGEEVGVGT